MEHPFWERRENMERKLALKVNEKDNVATLFVNGIKDGDEVEVRDKRELPSLSQ